MMPRASDIADHPVAVDAFDGPAGTSGEVDAPGAYGLRLSGLTAAERLAHVERDAPQLEVSFSCGRVHDRTERFTADRAEIALIDDGWISLERSGRAELILPQAVPEEEMLHPWLVPAAATFNGWLGRQVLHGGLYARDGRAVAVLGDKQAGKSTLLTWLALTDEFDILADDLVVIEDGLAFAGPRYIDLRTGSLDVLGPSNRHRLVRDGSRLRLELPAAAPAAELVGVVILNWWRSPEVALRSLAPSEGLASLLPHALGGGERGLHGRLLDLLHVPTWMLLRPRDWSIMPAVEEQLRGLLG